MLAIEPGVEEVPEELDASEEAPLSLAKATPRDEVEDYSLRDDALGVEEVFDEGILQEED